MKVTVFYLTFLWFLGMQSLHAQVVSVGGKFDKKPMFQASLNAPVFFNKYLPYDIAFGLDYTTRNKEAPSGLQPQVTGMYFIVDNDYKDFLVSANVTAGYLFDFNKQFANQFRVSPHVYFEIPFCMVKVGYDYTMPLNKGYPFVSVGLGGFLLFRHFKVM
ncbi:hypothetical protein [Sphingobacterium wenxiniae]|uniref:Outer membrane protein beta-barrel domain-containing protein n=1 Tax=Sphingobacterium wenxiniae TaxID=683125 RepID=A0A1I6UMA6_9SPHI|nr:hypothetical protein [Sphingobacterium wenxiniae]SFT02553.1 hypothetical protein SAMN05660206_109107 [Sphingobacterium wenxiniae]